MKDLFLKIKEKNAKCYFTSWNRAIIDPMLNCYSNLTQIKKPYNDNEIAIIPDCNSSALTFGPTFSTRLKFMSEFKLSDRFFFISELIYCYLLFVQPLLGNQIFTKFFYINIS